MSLDDSVERVREILIKRMGSKSYLRQKGLIESVATDLGESALTVKQCMGRLVRESWLDGVSPDGIPFAQIRIIGRVPVAPVDPNLFRWQEVMSSKGIVAHDLNSLTPLSAKLASFSVCEMANILEGLLRLRDNLSEESGRHRFLVSAKYLLGSSKLLDVLPSTSLRAFGISIDLFPSHPLYVVVAGCPNPDAVVLVENPAAFELAVTTQAIRNCAFIATFGFGLSKSQEDYGNQLAFMAEERFANAITLTREGSFCPTAKKLLNHPMVTFWGDLDIAGIQIYLRLKKAIPGLRLSALYTPMLASLDAPERSHPYVAVVGKSGQMTMATISEHTDPIAQDILSLCRLRGVDQEQVTASLIEAYAPFKLAFKLHD